MDIKTILAQFTTEELQKLAAAQSAGELAQIAAEFGHPISEEEDVLFAALYPVRGREPIDEEDLNSITGGIGAPLPTLRFSYRYDSSKGRHF